MARTLLAAASTLVIAASAAATEITEDTSDPLNTSTVDGGAPGDITVNPGVTVSPTEGTAITIDSNNSVTIAADDTGARGAIQIDDADNAVGIRALGGFTGDITNNGEIIIREDFTAEDTDEDGDFDTPFAQGSGRIGILIEGDDPFNGSITNTGADTAGRGISIEGNDSAGIRVATGLNGNINAGDITISGDRSVALDVQGAVSGDLNVDGSVLAIGEDSSGVRVAGDVSGAFVSTGATVATGFRSTSRSSFEEFRDRLDQDDLLDGGAAIEIGGDVAGGILIQGPDGSDEPPATSSVTAFGSSPAVHINAGLDPSRTNDVTIGLVADAGGAGFINRGAVSANGVNDGFAATGILLEGADGRRVIIQGGIDNDGSITATAFGDDDDDEDGVTTPIAVRALALGEGAQTPALTNDGIIDARVASTGEDSALAIDIASTASLTSLINDGTISAFVTSADGDAYAIRDLSGSLTTLENAGIIRAISGFGSDGTLLSGARVALDASAATSGVTVTQVMRADDDETDDVTPTTPSITGDVLLSANDDSLSIQAGELQGDVAFGAGLDSFILDGGSSFTGDLTDSDGRLVLVINDATATITNADVLGATELTLGESATLNLRVRSEGGTITTTRLDVSEVAVVSSSANFAPELSGFLSEDATLELVNAATLTTDGDLSDQLGEVPFLYDASLGVSETDPGSLLLTINRRTAEQLGLSTNQGIIYDALAAELGADVDLGTAFANVGDSQELIEALDQTLPTIAAAAVQFAVANLDGSVGAVANRLDTVRGEKESAAGVWAQEFATFIDREADPNAQGYRGAGFGFAAGIDRPLGPLYATGLSISVASNEIDETTTFDLPFSMTTVDLGAYAATGRGPFSLDLYSSIGANFFETDQNVQLGDVTREVEGDWRGYHASASLRAAYDIVMGRFFARPSVTFDYLQLRQDGYKQSSDSAVFDGSAIAARTDEMASSTAQLSLGGRFGGGGRTWWSPRLRVGYRTEFESDPYITEFRFAGGTPGTFVTLEDSELPESGAVYGFTFAAGNRYSSFALDYDADIRDGFGRHIARVTFRFLF